MISSFLAEVELRTDQGRSFTAQARAAHAPYALNYAMKKAYSDFHGDDECDVVRRIRCKVDKALV